MVHVESVNRELVHLVKHICETLKAKRLDCILVIPPAVTRLVQLSQFSSSPKTLDYHL